MTTIAYHHKSKMIAYDSRLTINDSIVTDSFDKMFVRGNRKFIMCGKDLSDVNKAVMSFPDAVDITTNPYGLLIEGGIVFCVMWNNGEVSTFPIEYDFTCGSGEAHAITALDLGFGAHKAVEMAAKRDVGTGGIIRSFQVR